MGVRGAPAPRFGGADGARRLDAVHAGHVDVGEQQVEAPFDHRLHRVIAGGDFGDLMAAAAQQFADQQHVDGIVLGQKDVQAVFGWHGVALGGGGGCMTGAGSRADRIRRRDRPARDLARR